MIYHHYNKSLKLLARKLRNAPTKAERIIWYELLCKEQFMGYKFLRQRIIENYIVDFYCKELQLIIEIDGKSHEFEEVQIKDIEREKRLKELGFEIIRFSDWEVKHNMPELQVLLRTKIEQITKTE